MRQGKYIVDSIENNLAKLLYSEDETIEVLKKISDLPREVKEGDILYLELDKGGSLVSSQILKEETQEARQAAIDLLELLP